MDQVDGATWRTTQGVSHVVAPPRLSGRAAAGAAPGGS
jgi:hypothetical protein